MVFNGVYSILSLDFGGGDVLSQARGQTALLQLYYGGSLVGQTTMGLNTTSALDQRIEITGVNFTSAFFGYVNSSLQLIEHFEVVDNIFYDGRQVLPPAIPPSVPEPASLPLLGLGLAGAVYVRKMVKNQRQ